MRIINYFILLIVLFFSISGCCKKENAPSQDVQIAFMADVHLQDIYGEFQDNDYKGVLNPGNGKFVIARTMQAQLNSTRIFNENYFAFLAALDDVAKRGIKYVVLPGDFSDDGQPLNVRGLKRILENYSEKHGLRFILTTGNHDPVRPFSMDAGKKDFMGDGGKPQAIMSNAGLYVPKSALENPVVITNDICRMGYTEIIGALGEFGFLPQKEDFYWETPFTSYQYDDYSFDMAKKQSSIENRNYLIPPFNTKVPDVSYLVEPEKDLWFLAIDANVYVPENQAEKEPENPSNYEGASIGYNNVFSHKNHLITWVKSVTERADKLGKKLVVFSHYPMIDFNDDASGLIKNLMGDGKMQLHRVPEESIAKIFSDAGVKVHFGGHLHINDTGYRKYDNGKSLVNIQIPSLAAYIPAYKIARFGNDKVEVKTIVIDSVPRFKELFPLYEKEFAYLNSTNTSNSWDKNILTASTYHEFTSWHLKELVRLRFLKSDWPEDFREFLLKSTGKDLLLYSKASTNESENDLNKFESWTGFDMIYDFYRLRSADKLAIKDIGLDRIKQYELINSAILNHLNEGSIMVPEFHDFANILHHFLNGEPTDHFQVNLIQGEIIDLKN